MNDLDLLSLHRLARAATDLGHYNAGKLLIAAAASLTNRKLSNEVLPKTDADFAVALGALEPMLAAAGVEAGLPAMLKNIRGALTEGRMILYDDAPPVFVCRVCGEAAFHSAPEHCPHCGAGTLTFQNFHSTYYLDPEPVPLVLAQLAATPDWLDRTLAGLTQEQAERKVAGAEGEWSLHEAAGHLLDAQDLISFRVGLFMENEKPNLSAKAVWEMVESARLSANKLAAVFRDSRAAMLAQLREVTPMMWTRVGQHTEFGPVTLQQQATYFAKHEQWHMAQMTRIRRALG